MSVTFDELIVALAAKPGSGGWYNAHCPAHDDKNPSFGFKRGTYIPVLLKCLAHCEEEAIVEALEARGLWPIEIDPERQIAIERIEARLELPPGLLKFDAKLINPEGEIVDHYLRSRGIDLRDLDDIQFHPRAWHKPTDTYWPCMVAAVREPEGKLRSVHRTWLNGEFDPPQKAPLEKPRMVYGGAEVSGCAIHLSPAAETLVLAEGIETTASTMKLYGLPGWSGISCTFLPDVILPEIVREVILPVDNDPPKLNAKGEEIDPGAGEKATRKAAARFRREGRRVERIRSPYGNDFNDLLMWQLQQRERNHAR